MSVKKDLDVITIGRAWLTGQISDAQAISQMADRYRSLSALCDQARKG